MVSRRLISTVAASVVAVALALLAGSLIILTLKDNPAQAIYALFNGALGSNFGLGTTINLTAVLLFTGLSSLVGFTAGVWNFGMEGQLYMGALAAVGVVFGLQGLSLFVVPVALLAATVAGGLFAAVAGLLRVKLNVFEAVSTILLNYVAYLLVDYVAAGPLHQKGAAINATPLVPIQFRLQNIPGTLIQPMIFVGILASIGVFFLFRRTKFGYELRVMGGNYRAAEYVGVNIQKSVVLTMLISGGLSGFAGGIFLLGTSYSVFLGISKSYGWLGVAVALLGSLNPIASILSSFFFSILNVGGGIMESTTGVPFEVAQVMAALIVIVILVRPVIEKVLRR